MQLSIQTTVPALAWHLVAQEKFEANNSNFFNSEPFMRQERRSKTAYYSLISLAINEKIDKYASHK